MLRISSIATPRMPQLQRRQRWRKPSPKRKEPPAIGLRASRLVGPNPDAVGLLAVSCQRPKSVLLAHEMTLRILVMPPGRRPSIISASKSVDRISLVFAHGSIQGRRRLPQPHVRTVLSELLIVFLCLTAWIAETAWEAGKASG